MIEILIQVKPGSSKNQLSLNSAKELVVKLRAKPIDGEANAALLEFLSKELKIRKSSIEIVKGATSRVKKIRLLMPPEKWNGIIDSLSP